MTTTDLPKGPDADVDRLEPTPIEGAEDKALGQATMYLRAIRSLDRHAASIQEQYDEERQRIDSWRDDLMSGITRRRAQLVSLLEQFGRSYKQRTGHAPRRLPYGRITLSAPRPSLEVVDEAAFLDWAEGNQRLDLLEQRSVPKKDAIKQAMETAGGAEVPNPDPSKKYQALRTPEGEPVPGVVLSTPREDSASVKVDP